MALPCFFHLDLTLESTPFDISTTEAYHAIKSRRLKVGQQIKIINGQGLVGIGRIVTAENRLVRVAIDAVKQHVRERHVCIATAIPKRDRQKIMVDMLTQLGVSRIIPLRCDYSVTRYKASMGDKWRRIALEACKQSHNPWLPEISEEVRVSDLALSGSESLLFADARGHALAQESNGLSKLIVMIGPEGGFSDTEQVLFHDQGIKSVTLAGHILRTETAAITAAAQSV